MKWLLLLAGACLSSTSIASFELMLVADLNGRDIDRYDAVTGTYLGSFGFGYLTNPTDVDVDSASGLAYVTDSTSSNIRVFNYNTGELVRYWSTSTSNSFITKLNSGNILTSAFGNVNSYQFTPTGSLVRIQSTNVAQVLGHAQTADGNIWWSDLTARGLWKATETASNPTLAYSYLNVSGQGFLSASGNELASSDFASGTQLKVTRYMTSGGVVTSEVSVSLGTTASEVVGGTAFGHNGVLYAAVGSASGSRYATWLRGDNAVTMRSLSGTQYAQGMTIVNAPEPASLVAVGAGILALARRKRRE